MNVSEFESGRPEFRPTKFFEGRTSSFGVMKNRGGVPKQVVRTKTEGHWDGDTLRLEQDLSLGNSKPQHRSWRLLTLLWRALPAAAGPRQKGEHRHHDCGPADVPHPLPTPGRKTKL